MGGCCVDHWALINVVGPDLARLDSGHDEATDVSELTFLYNCEKELGVDKAKAMMTAVGDDFSLALCARVVQQFSDYFIILKNLCKTYQLINN